MRRAIAALFRKSTLEEKGGLIIKDVMNMCDKIEEETGQGRLKGICFGCLNLPSHVDNVFWLSIYKAACLENCEYFDVMQRECRSEKGCDPGRNVQGSSWLLACI